MDNMEKIEKEFHNLKEKLYQDQIDWLKQDYQRIRTGNTSLSFNFVKYAQNQQN